MDVVCGIPAAMVREENPYAGVGERARLARTISREGTSRGTPPRARSAPPTSPRLQDAQDELPPGWTFDSTDEVYRPPFAVDEALVIADLTAAWRVHRQHSALSDGLQPSPPSARLRRRA